MQSEYRWGDTITRLPPGCSVPGPAEAYNALVAIRRKSGDLTAEAVVEASRPRRAALHKAFVWDDAEAARLQRLETARLVMRSLEIVVTRKDSDPVVGRVLVSLRNRGDGVDGRGRNYVPVADALSDDEWRAELLGRALAEAEAWRQRYINLTELADVFAALDRVA